MGISSSDTELSGLPNVGKVLEGSLRQVGIDTPEQLRQLGAEEVFLRIRTQVDTSACLRMLYGIEGAIQGIPDKDLSTETKSELKQFFRTMGR